MFSLWTHFGCQLSCQDECLASCDWLTRLLFWFFLLMLDEVCFFVYLSSNIFIIYDIMSSAKG